MAGLLAALGTWQVTCLAAEMPQKNVLPPSLRMPLSELGFPGYAVSLLHAGASMATVHALDSTHVLFTYSLRSLVPRLPGDDASDSDRQVAAVLVEVPGGKVLSRTVWHLHDHRRYLWSAGNGVFVLRVGSELSVFAPLRALAAGSEPFRRYALPHRPGQPVMVTGSPDAKLITVAVESGRQHVVDDDEPGMGQKPRHYTLEFFRLTMDENTKQPIQVEGAGVVGSPVLLRLAMDGDGYLWAENGKHGSWTVSFNEFAGKQETLAPVHSTCAPRLTLLSRGEFLAETCHGPDEAPMFAAFGFDGHENWEEHFSEALQPPTLALAPSAGRFAMSRLLRGPSPPENQSTLVGDDPISQEIRVYQVESGDMLLRVPCAPAVKTAENFDLSPDGKLLVVLSAQTLDIYDLPDLSQKDKQDLAEVDEMTPPVGKGPVVLARITRPIQTPESESIRAKDDASTGPDGLDSAAAPPAAPAADAAGIASPVPAGAPPADAAGIGSPVADPQPSASASDEAKSSGPAAANAAQTTDQASSGPENAPAPQHRKPPTLLNPQESSEYKGPAGKPQ